MFVTPVSDLLFEFDAYSNGADDDCDRENDDNNDGYGDSHDVIDS